MSLTYTIEQLKAQWPDAGNPFPNNIGDATVIIPELVRELEARNKIVKEFEGIRAELNNAPCGDALDRLWKEIILARNPDYGDWEYPGMAYRYLKAEFDDLTRELRAQEVTTINERLRTARECAEITDKHEAEVLVGVRHTKFFECEEPICCEQRSMAKTAREIGKDIRQKFKVPA